MNIIIIIFLILVGILLLMLEFAVIPGVTVAGIGGALMLLTAVFLAFKSYGIGIGFATLGFVLLITPVLFYNFLKSKAGKKMILDSAIIGRSTEIKANTIHPGDEGVTISRLAPIGKARINGEVVEAKSISGILDPHTRVRVVELLKTQIIVEPVN